MPTVLVLGGTGPMSSTRRRPWIDWIHTANGQGGVVRDFTKWEHQPVGVEAIPEALLRAWHVMSAEPQGPVYVCFDVTDQERGWIRHRRWRCRTCNVSPCPVRSRLTPHWWTRLPDTWSSQRTP